MWVCLYTRHGIPSFMYGRKQKMATFSSPEAIRHKLEGHPLLEAADLVVAVNMETGESEVL